MTSPCECKHAGAIPSKLNARVEVPRRVPTTKFAIRSAMAVLPRKHAEVVGLIQVVVWHMLLVLPIRKLAERSYLFSRLRE